MTAPVAGRRVCVYCASSTYDPELLAICQDIKTLQWQIDESWTEINHLGKQ